MPKLIIDYSNTIIYKICCKNESINELYVGHTTNFVQRKSQHKQGSYDVSNKCKLYETIRNNGGWDNWNMEIIDFKNCENSYEARKIEQYYFETLNATLNSVTPLSNLKIVSNKVKNIAIKNKDDINIKIHNQTQPQTSNANKINKSQFHCKSCDFITSNKKDYNRHLMTKKHASNQYVTNEGTNGDSFTQKTQPNSCKNCGKIYKSRNGLWCHKKLCKSNTPESEENPKDDKTIDKETIMMLLQQNNEFKDLLKEQSDLLMEQAKEHQRQLFELAKNGNNNSITNNITNNNNQKFNMNFFLNEQCKDALDIMDFVNSLQLSVSDLENTGNVGYVKGVSDIFLRGLRDLDVYKRPIHCSDLKREVMYIKDNDVWEKDEDNKKVKKAIQYVGGKNFKQISEWVVLNPESKDVRSKKHEQYVKILTKCTGGADSEEDDALFGKIITNVAKEVTIDK
jgi:hypothetical protein